MLLAPLFRFGKMRTRREYIHETRRLPDAGHLRSVDPPLVALVSPTSSLQVVGECDD